MMNKDDDGAGGVENFFRKKILCLLDKKKCKVYKTSQGNEVVGISSTCDLFYLTQNLIFNRQRRRDFRLSK